MAATGIELIRPDWPAPDHIHAVATTRTGGVSSGSYASLNLGTHVGDDPRSVAKNRIAAALALEITQTPRWLDQVHGTSVIAADSVTSPPA